MDACLQKSLLTGGQSLGVRILAKQPPRLQVYQISNIVNISVHEVNIGEL